MQDIKHLKESPSQTAGPYVHIGCVPNFSGITGVYPEDLGQSIMEGNAKGDRVKITGCVWDGTGHALSDAVCEVWQADANGIYPGNDPRGPADPAFHGWARLAGDQTTGEWVLETVKPGAIPHPSGRMQLPHLNLWIVARGINIGLQTRMYFPEDDPTQDPILSRIEHKNRVPTLFAKPDGAGAYRFDIRLQGADETIFFDV
ncbi:MAG: protocatechuate 3,4-dioxygenase subunit alpha [Pseudomonadota bacterium]